MLGRAGKGVTVRLEHVAVVAFITYILTGWTPALDVTIGICIFVLINKI